MNSPLPPLPPAASGAVLPVQGAPVAPVPGSAGAAAPAGTGPVAAPAAVPGAAAPAPAAATAGAPPVPATPPAATAVRWSAEMLQNLRLQAFAQLVAQLARQVQASPNAPAPQWPAQGVSEALGRMLQMLLEQMGAQQGRPLQVLAAQPGSAALMQALAAAHPQAASPSLPTPVSSAPVPAPAAPASTPGSGAVAAPAAAPASASPPPAAALASLATAAAKAAGIDALLAAAAPAQAARGAASPADAAVPAGAAAANGAPASRGAAPPLPPLQNWWVQQGTLVTPQGERSFMLSLQVPQAWAQAQLAATAQPGAAPQAAPAAALPAGALAAQPGAALAAPAAGAWRLPLDVPLQALASGPVAVVLQPRDEPQLRTSALLLLEFQPQRQAAGQVQPALPVTALSPAMVQEMQQLLQNRGDPWLQMAVAQNANALPRERSGHQSHLCTTAGCQYEGRAPCAQPFCSEMNRLWGVARAQRA